MIRFARLVRPDALVIYDEHVRCQPELRIDAHTYDRPDRVRSTLGLLLHLSEHLANAIAPPRHIPRIEGSAHRMPSPSSIAATSVGAHDLNVGLPERVPNSWASVDTAMQSGQEEQGEDERPYNYCSLCQGMDRCARMSTRRSAYAHLGKHVLPHAAHES